jgi:vitamin B12/bleomycin/antimicrobial peptide transport system ATP-binding/permease protein
MLSSLFRDSINQIANLEIYSTIMLGSLLVLIIVLFGQTVNGFGFGTNALFRKFEFSHSNHSKLKVALKATKVSSNANPTSSSNNSSNLSLGLSQLQPFLKIAVPYFQNDTTARNSLITLSALTLFKSGISVAFSYISRDFYNALNARDEPLFYEKIELFFAALVIAVPTSVYYRFVREKLSIYWREALTAQALQRLYANRTYYIFESLKEVDNPDQRISEDIRHFTRTSLDFFITIFTSIIDLFSFSAILFQIFPGLFVAIILYAGIGSFITTQLGQSLVSLNYDRLQREANFRFALFRTRENAEAIAFYDPNAQLEQTNLWKLFQEALSTQLSIILVQRNLETFTTSYRYIVQILPSLIVAPLYFAKKVELGAISQSYSAFNHILDDFSIIINSFESLSVFSAGLTRLADFFEQLNQDGWDRIPLANRMMTGSSTTATGEQQQPYQRKPIISLSTSNLSSIKQSPQHLTDVSKNQSMLLQCSNLTIFTPDFTRTILGNIPSTEDPNTFTGIDFTLHRGDRILLVGPSGSGKSSFVRVIAGLWQVGFGQIIWDNSLLEEKMETVAVGEESSSSVQQRSAPSSVFFLPQKPYNVLGDLRVQIMYPSTLRDYTSIHDNSTIYDRIRIDQSPSPEDITETPAIIDFPPDEIFLKLLEKVKLENLAARMGNGDPKLGLRHECDWSKILSVGEQQRLAFARVLYNKPQVLILDGK